MRSEPTICTNPARVVTRKIDFGFTPAMPRFETRSLPALTRSYPRHFTFYVAHPIRSIETRSLPALARSYPRHFTLITRTASCSRQLPSCFAVYPRD